MRVIRVDPVERMPNLVDRDDPVFGYRNLMVNLPRYQCPHCGDFTVFETKRTEPTLLPPDVWAQFDALTPHRSPYEQGTSDFLCRSCSRPVRIVFRIEEFQMASYYFYAELVIETASE